VPGADEEKTMLLMKVTIVAGCECKRHAWVHLHDATGEHRIRVLIDAAAGRAIVSELRGAPTPHAGTVDLLSSSLEALGARAERVELRCMDGGLCGVLRLRAPGGEATALVDPCHALLAACRMSLPIVMDEADAAGTDGPAPPDAFDQFLSTLDLSGLGDPTLDRDP
jgi:bifunctional DNase/RNase